jgi:type I site-specific restriction endonuclease
MPLVQTYNPEVIQRLPIMRQAVGAQRISIPTHRDRKVRTMTQEQAIQELETKIKEIEKRITTLEPMSTGWKTFTGIKIGYKLALDILTKCVCTDEPPYQECSEHNGY